MSALRKLLAALLLGAFVCVGIPSMPLAGGADDPGYVGGGGNKGEDSDYDLDPNTRVGGGVTVDQEPFQRTTDPSDGESFSAQFANSLLLHLLGFIAR